MSDPGGPQPPRPIRPGPVIGGIALGAVLAVVVQASVALSLLSAGVQQTPGFLYAIFLLPGLIGGALLLSRRTRQMGAGLMLGLSIGAIVIAGVCTAMEASPA